MNFWFEGVCGTFVTLSGQDGQDARTYHEKQVRTALDRVREATGAGS